MKNDEKESEEYKIAKGELKGGEEIPTLISREVISGWGFTTEVNIYNIREIED